MVEKVLVVYTFKQQFRVQLYGSITLPAFTADEVTSFFTKTVLPNCLPDAVRCGRQLGGFPIALQLLRELCVQDQHRQTGENGDDNVPGLKDLLEQWLLAFDDTGVRTPIVEALATVPFVGMDKEALLKVIARPFNEQDQIFERMKRLGLLTEVCAAGTETTGTILIIHQSIRATYKGTVPADLLTWRQRYLSLLEERLSSSETTHHGVLTCVDAWISGWTEVFDLSSGQSQEERYRKQHSLLEKLFDTDSTAWETALNSMPHFLRGHLLDPGAESCALVIGIAHMISRLKGNRSLENTIWLGCRNTDLWARAASIAATLGQWEKLGTEGMKRGVKELGHWIKYAYEMREFPIENDPLSQLDLDFLATVCGLVRLTNNINIGLDVVQSDQFKKRFPKTTLSHLALLIRLADDGVFADGHPRQNDFKRLALQWAEKVHETHAKIQYTALRVGRYLRKTSGFEIVNFLSIYAPLTEESFAPDIASLSNSQRFFEFASNNFESNPRHFLPWLLK